MKCKSSIGFSSAGNGRGITGKCKPCKSLLEQVNIGYPPTNGWKK